MFKIIHKHFYHRDTFTRGHIIRNLIMKAKTRNNFCLHPSNMYILSIIFLNHFAFWCLFFWTEFDKILNKCRTNFQAKIIWLNMSKPCMKGKNPMNARTAKRPSVQNQICKSTLIQSIKDWNHSNAVFATSQFGESGTLKVFKMKKNPTISV